MRACFREFLDFLWIKSVCVFVTEIESAGLREGERERQRLGVTEKNGIQGERERIRDREK